MDLIRIIRMKNPNSSKRLEVYNKNTAINATTLKENKSVRFTLMTIIMNYRP